MGSYMDDYLESVCDHGLTSVPDRQITPHFLRDKSIVSHVEDHCSFPSGLKHKDFFEKNILSRSNKIDGTNRSIANLKSTGREEHSTQAYELRSIKVNFKNGNMTNRGSMSQADNKVAKVDKLSFVGMIRKPSDASEENSKADGSSLMHCIENPRQGIFCEKMPDTNRNNVSKQAPGDVSLHLHSHVKKIKSSFSFKNKFKGCYSSQIGQNVG